MCTNFSASACAFALLAANSALAAITVTGDVNPAIPPGGNLGATAVSVGDVATGTVTVNGGSTVTSGQARLGFAPTGDGVATVSGAGSRWDIDNNIFIVGRQGTGELNITAGALVTSGVGSVGRFAGSDGVVNIDGDGSTWRNQRDLLLGGTNAVDGGTASVLLDSGGGRLLVGDINPLLAEENLVASQPAIVVSDSDATGGNLLIRNGGSAQAVTGLFAGGALHIGMLAGHTGEVAIVGDASELIATSVHVGPRGAGVVSVADGANFGGVDIFAASKPGGSATIDLSGSVGAVATLVAFNRLVLGVDDAVAAGGQADVSVGANSRLYVGSGDALLLPTGVIVDEDAAILGPDGGIHVRNGSTLTSTGMAAIGFEAGESGSVVVDDTDSTWTHTGDMTIGDQGDGDLDVGQLSTVTTTNAWVGRTPGSSGNVTTSGLNNLENSSLFHVTGKLVIGGEVIEGAFIAGGDGSVANNQNGRTVVGDNVEGVSSIGTTLLVTRSTPQQGFDVVVMNDGSLFSNGNTIVGYHPGETGSVLLTGVDSELDTDEVSYIGHMGVGLVEVRDGAFLDDRGAATVMVGASPGGHGTLRVTGAGSRWETGPNPDLPASIGYEGTGVLEVLAGGAATHEDSLLIGSDPGSVGTATVSGIGSLLSAEQDLHVGGKAAGAGGVGVLNIGGGALTNVDGTLTIWDQGTVNVLGGTLEMGALSMPNGAFNFEFGAVRFSGDATLDSTLAQNLFGQMQPVIGPNRSLSIEGHAEILTPIALGGGSLSIDSISDASLINFDQGTLQIDGVTTSISGSGLFGAELALSDGQQLIFGQNQAVGADGRLVMRGGRLTLNTPSSLTNNGVITGAGVIDGITSNQTTGVIDIRGGEHLRMETVQNFGAATVLGGEWEITGSYVSGSASTIIAEDATLRFRNGISNQGTLAFSTGVNRVFGDFANTVADQVIVSGDASATFFDDFTNSGVVQVSANATAVFFGYSGSAPVGTGAIFIESDLRPGFSPGEFAFAGDLSLGAGAVTEIELAGLSPGDEFDKLTIGGHLSLGGALEVLLIDNESGPYSPTLGDSFEIASAAEIAGSFSTVSLPQLGGDLGWQYHQSAGSVLLSVVSILPGDYNGDLRVDALDFAVWREHLGDPDESALGHNGNGAGVDPSDFDFWLANYGRVGGAATPPALAPEPGAAISLALLGVMTLGAQRRSRGPLRS